MRYKCVVVIFVVVVVVFVAAVVVVVVVVVVIVVRFSLAFSTKSAFSEMKTIFERETGFFPTSPTSGKRLVVSNPSVTHNSFAGFA